MRIYDRNSYSNDGRPWPPKENDITIRLSFDELRAIGHDIYVHFPDAPWEDDALAKFYAAIQRVIDRRVDKALAERRRGQ